MRDVTEILRQYQAQHHAVAQLAKFSDVTEDVVSTFRHGREHNGEPLPWRKTHELFRFRPHELTIWAGFNNHGKTLVLSDIMANSISHHGTTWAVGSFEMPLARLAERFVIQCSVSQRPAEGYIRKCLSWTDDKVFVFDETDSVEPDRVLAFAQMAFDHLEVDHVVIDSLVKCGVNTRENEPQKRFVDQLQSVAKHHGGHIHLVHHLRKGEHEEAIPTKQDLKGAGELSDLADNVILVHRNKRKERELAEGKDVERLELQPDARLIVDKQRHFEWSGSIRLWFSNEGLRFVSNPDERPRWYGPSLKDLNAGAGSA